LLFSYFHSIPSKTKLKTQVGGTFSWQLAGDEKKVLTYGVEHEVDDNTLVKAKLDHNISIAAYLEHRLSNPLLKVGLTSSWDWKKKTFTPEKFGVGLTFGDF